MTQWLLVDSSLDLLVKISKILINLIIIRRENEYTAYTATKFLSLFALLGWADELLLLTKVSKLTGMTEIPCLLIKLHLS